MPLSQINKKLILVLFLVFVISALYIFYPQNKENYSDTFLGNNNNSSITNIYPGDSIQQAINNTSSGGTVTVYPGLYKENLVIDKPLKIIRSNEKESTYAVIQAADPEEDIFHITADNVTISGFNITGAQSKTGIYCSGSDGNITGNKLSYNMYGVYINDSNRNIVENNEVNNNSFGIYLKNSNSNQVSSNNVSGVGIFVGLENEAEGIYLEDSNGNKLMSNAISKLWEGVNLTNSSNNELNNNSILHNYFSLLIVNSNNNKVLNNIIVKRGYSFSVALVNSQNNTLQGNNKGLDTEFKVYYSSKSKNNTLEGELYTVNKQGTGGVFRVK